MTTQSIVPIVPIDTGQEPIYLPHLRRELFKTMEQIDNIDNNKWHYYRKLVNVYDFNSRKIAFNRAFYKLWEILHIHDNLLHNVKNSCHLAEAPGSFVQVMNILLPNCKMIAISRPSSLYSDVLKTSHVIPIFSTKIISSVPSCKFIYMNLLDNSVLDSFTTQYSNSFDFITADGGIDDQEQYINKEEIHQDLINSEINAILKTLKIGGNCVLKVFDLFHHNTITILWNLCQHFKSFHLIKPCTSRPTNSEKYLICIDFKKNITREMPDYFKNYILDHSRFFANIQIQSINYVLKCIHNKFFIDKKEMYKKKHDVFIKWKRKFNL
jgi:23S rRNA U2552 (ribose-2'-O)-methylase RlmE/FtsJ